MKKYALTSLLLLTGMAASTVVNAQWLGPWGNENDLAAAWGLEPQGVDDPDEGPGVTIDYNNPEQPFGMSVQSGSQTSKPLPPPPSMRMRPQAPAPVKPTPAPPPLAKALPKPPEPIKPIPRTRQDYYSRMPPMMPRNFNSFQQPLRPRPYYAPRPLPPIRMPAPMPPYPYYRR